MATELISFQIAGGELFFILFKVLENVNWLQAAKQILNKAQYHRMLSASRQFILTKNCLIKPPFKKRKWRYLTFLREKNLNGLPNQDN